MQNIQDVLAKRQILKPRSVIITSRYFWRKWRPILGNSLAVLIMESRQKCYRNLQTGEVRNWFYATMKELGQTTGFSSKKIASLLKKPHAQKFIRYKPTYIYNPELGKRIKGKCLFQVTLDDPLIPEDELQVVGQEINNEAIISSLPKGQFDRKVESLRKQPNSPIVFNKYSTLEEININKIYNETTKEEKVEPMMQNCIEEKGNGIVFTEIIDEIGKESNLSRTILDACLLGEINVQDGLARISIKAPNNHYRQVLDVCLRKKLTTIFEEKIKSSVLLHFDVSSRSSAHDPRLPFHQ